MLDPEDDRSLLRKACYEAYNEAVKGAYRTLANSIVEYFDEDAKRPLAVELEVSPTFRPLKEYKQTLRIQRFALQLALRAVDQESAQFVPDTSNLAIASRDASRPSRDM